MTFACQK